MSDREPGSSYWNPIMYRNYRIYLSDHGGYSYVHEDYDGAEDGHDHRCGMVRTLDEAKAEIDELEGERDT